MIYGIIIGVVIVLDQITKFAIRSNLQIGEKLPVIGDWFRITFVQNTGTAFSMFSGNKLVTLALTSILIIACSVLIYKEARQGSKHLAICLTFVIAGGIANMIDRFTLGYVTDMISVGSFAVFNIADIAITCGCFISMILVILEFKNEQK